VSGAHICSVYEPHVDFTVTSIDSTDLLFTPKQKKLNTRVVGQTNSTGYTIRCKNVEAQASTHHLLIIGSGQSDNAVRYSLPNSNSYFWCVAAEFGSLIDAFNLQSYFPTLQDRSYNDGDMHGLFSFSKGWPRIVGVWSAFVW